RSRTLTRAERVAKWRRRGRIALAHVVDVRRASWRRRAEITLSIALVAGWGLVTDAIATIGRPRLVWPLSIGLFLLSASGWSMVFTIARHGLYALARDERTERG